MPAPRSWYAASRATSSALSAALEMEPMAVAEDFSRVIELVPGALFCLGVRHPSWTEPRGMHTATFDLDEAALPIGAAMMAGVALRFLNAQ